MAVAQMLYRPAPVDQLLEDEEAALSDQEEEVQGRGVPTSLPPYRRRVFLLLGASLLAAALLTLLMRPDRSAGMSMHWAEGTVGLAEDMDPCSGYPFISLDEVIHSNLGGQGPDVGDEGIVFRAKDYIPGQAPVDLLVVVNASSAYRAGHAKFNGIHGKYGLITLQPGNEAMFTFRIYDAATLQPKTLPKQTFTFFDLDQSNNGDNREYIQVAGASQVWLTKNTEVKVIDLPGGVTQFMSSRHGWGADNPKDPLALTVQQKNRAVTLEFQDFDELTVTLGCTEGVYARYFMFVARPSLLCAQTVGRVEHGEDEVVSVSSTTPPPSTSTDAPKQCLYVVPVVNYCVPMAWKFWSW